MPFDNLYADKLEILHRTRDLLMQGWCQGAYYCNNSHCVIGAITTSTESFAARHYYMAPENQRSDMTMCAIGERIAHEIIIGHLYPLLPFPYKFKLPIDDDTKRVQVVHFNDGWHTTKEDVISLLDRAIETLSNDCGICPDHVDDAQLERDDVQLPVYA